MRFMILIASAALVLIPAGVSSAASGAQLTAPQLQPTDIGSAAKKKKKTKPSDKMKAAPSEPPKGAYN